MHEEEKDFSVNTELDEPHFDDERTLLSAKPVVPLDQVQSESRMKALRLTATITVAVVLGTLGARFVYYRRAVLLPVQPTFRDITSDVGGQFEEPEQAKEVVIGVEQAGLKEPPNQDKSEDLRQQEELENSGRPRLQKTRATRQNRVPETDSETTGEQQVSRRVSQWEERRERRARRNGASSKSDLGRIDEIFEGTPSP
jgi:hypothetical protein